MDPTLRPVDSKVAYFDRSATRLHPKTASSIGANKPLDKVSAEQVLF